MIVSLILTKCLKKSRIMKTCDFKKIFFSGLHDKKILLNEIDPILYDEILSLSDKFLMAGYLSKNIENKVESNYLINGLKNQSKLGILKNLIEIKFIKQIAGKLEMNNITYCFLKGTALRLIYPKLKNTRFSRDIDILVNESDIQKTYELMKHLGFYYQDSLVSDSAEFTKTEHQLPVMINDDGIILEIHHRVTSRYIFDKCKLSKVILSERRFKEVDGLNIYHSSGEQTICHLIYHAFLHHKKDFGPSFLYDIKLLKKDFENGIINKLINSNGLGKEYDSSMDIINNNATLSLYKKFYDSVTEKIKRNKNPKRLRYFFFTIGGLKEFFSIIRFKIFSTEGRFQVRFLSLRYFYVFTIIFLRAIKRRFN